MPYSNTPSAVHLDVPLTNLTLAYVAQENFIADKVFPTVEVDKQSNLFYTFDADEYNREGDVQEIAPGTGPNKFELSHSNSNYFARIFGIAVNLDEQTLANEDTQLMTRSRKINAAVRKMLVKRERDFVNRFIQPGVWGTEVVGVAAAPAAGQVRKWSDAVSTPIKDIRAAKQAIHLRTYGFTPNTLVLPRRVLDVLMDHPDILARMNGGATPDNPAMIDMALLARIFGMERVLISDVVTNTAAEGLAATRAFMAGDHALLVHTPKTAGLETPAAGLTFAWNAVPGASYGITTESFTDDGLRRVGIAEEIQAKMAYDMKVTGPQLGYFFNAVI